jgi:hypothetical protein
MKQVTPQFIIDQFYDIAIEVAKAWCPYAVSEDMDVHMIEVKDNKIIYYLTEYMDDIQFPPEFTDLQKMLLAPDDENEDEDEDYKTYIWGGTSDGLEIYFQIKPQFKIPDQEIILKDPEDPDDEDEDL